MYYLYLSFLSSPRLPSLTTRPLFHLNSTACRDLITQSAKKEVKARGPARIPTKVLRITTRKTPCGEGSKTWDRFEMRIHKRVIDLNTTLQAMKEITAIRIESGVDVEVTVVAEN